MMAFSLKIFFWYEVITICLAAPYFCEDIFKQICTFWPLFVDLEGLLKFNYGNEYTSEISG